MEAWSSSLQSAFSDTDLTASHEHASYAPEYVNLLVLLHINLSLNYLQLLYTVMHVQYSAFPDIHISFNILTNNCSDFNPVKWPCWGPGFADSVNCSCDRTYD